MRPPSAHPPPTQPPPISGQPPVVYFTPRQQANQFKLESSPNTRALKVIQTNPNQVLPNPIYNRRPQQQGVNNNNNNTNNITIYQQPNISNFQPNNPYSPRPGVGGEQNTSLPPHPLFNQPIESQDLEKSNSISSTNTATEAPVAIKVENEVKVEPNSEDPAKTQDENI